MGRTRQQPQTRERQPQSPSAEIAMILLSGVAAQAMVAKIAPLFLLVLPPALLRLPALAASVATEAARLIVDDTDELAITGDGLVRQARIDNVIRRALYGMAAARRLGAAAVNAEPGKSGEAVAKALDSERRYFLAHKNVSARSIKASRVVEALVDLHGPVLSWRHGVTRRPIDPRKNHRRSDGKNVNVLKGPPRYTGAWPGVLPHCSCAFGPPNPGGGRVW